MRTETLNLGTLFYGLMNPLLPTFPIIAEQGTPQPFAVYRRTGVTLPYTKDRYNYEEVASYEVIITASTYPECVRLAQDVKARLDGLRGEWEGNHITEIKLTNTDEDWHNDGYIQRLYFTIKTDINK